MHDKAEAAQRALRLGTDLSGVVVSGEVLVGEHFVQMHAEHGAVLDYVSPEARPVPRRRATPRSTMPRDLPSLLGRDDELHAARRILATGAPVEVAGEPGIGKTALLRHICKRSAESGDLASVLFLWAAGKPGEDILQSLFDSFYECDSAIVPTVAEVKRYVGDRRGLVVLDDADLARLELERVMSLAPHCVFAIAAREPRSWGGERSIALGGLDEQSCLALAERELTRALTAHERASLGRLAVALEGHPLRIVQAAHLMIQRRRPRSDRAAAAGSPKDEFDELVAQSLEDDEERLLAPLAALPGVALEARRLADITGMPDAPRVLASLEERGLVRAHGGCYSLAGTAIAAIGRRVDRTAWRERALEHYGRAEEAISAVEAPAILALLDAGAKAGNQRAVIRLARNAGAPLALGARWGAWRETLDHALVAARELRDQRSEAWALHQLGSRAVCLGDPHGGADHLNHALYLRDWLGDEEGARLTRHNLEALTDRRATPSAPTPTPAPPAPSTASPGPPSTPAPPRPPTMPPPSRRSPLGPTRRNRPPLKPVIAVIAATVLVVSIGLAVSGGDEDAPAPSREKEKGTSSGQRPNERPGGRAARRGRRRKPRALPAVIEPRALQFTARATRLSKPLLVRGENIGAASITLGKVHLAGRDRGDFVTTDGCTRSRLSRGERCTVAVSFVPAKRRGAETRTRTAVLIFSDDGRGGRQTVSLRGSVTTS